MPAAYCSVERAWSLFCLQCCDELKLRFLYQKEEVRISGGKQETKAAITLRGKKMFFENFISAPLFPIFLLFNNNKILQKVATCKTQM